MRLDQIEKKEEYERLGDKVLDMGKILDKRREKKKVLIQNLKSCGRSR